MPGLGEILRTPLFTIAGTQVNGATLLTVVVVFVVTFWISRTLQRAIGRFLARRNVVDRGSVGVTQRLVHYLVMALGLGVGLHTLGINLTTFFAAGAFVAVALGFAMQEITQNFVSGVILLVERTIKPDDVLEVEGRMVRVTHLGTRATVVRTLDEEDLIVPNSVLVQSTVKNYTLRDALYRLRAEVGVTYDSDMKVVDAALREAVADLPWRSKKHEPVVLMSAFGSSSVDFEVSVWSDDPWRQRSCRSEMLRAIWWGLKDAGVTIAFPQLDVHLDPPVSEALARLGPRS